MLAETHPLIQNAGNGANPIMEAWDGIYSGAPLRDSCAKKSARIGLTVLAGIFSASAKVFYIPISLKIGEAFGGGDPVGIAVAASNAKAFFILEMWAATGIIQDMLGPKTAGELELKRKQISICFSICTVAAAVFVSAFAQIPYAYPAADYNPDYPALAGIVSLVASIFLPARSMQLTIESVWRKARSTKKETKILKKRKRAIKAIKGKRIEFRQMNNGAQDDFISAFEGHPSGDAAVRSILEGSEQQQVPTFLKRHGMKGPGLILAALFEYAFTDYTYYQTKNLIYDSDALAIGMASAVCLTTLYLYGKSLVGTTERVLFSVTTHLRCKGKQSLGKRMHPYLNTALKIEEAIVNVLALGPTVIIWGNFFEDPLWEHNLFIITMSLSLYLLILTASLDMIDALTEKSKERKAVLETDGKLQRLIASLKTAKFEDVKTFFDALELESKA